MALARVCYARPHVALLDDPLSAVDARVGRTLFGQGISEVMKVGAELDAMRKMNEDEEWWVAE